MIRIKDDLYTYCFLVSGGFATINPDSTLNINAVEAAALDEISPEVRKKKKGSMQME